MPHRTHPRPDRPLARRRSRFPDEFRGALRMLEGALARRALAEPPVVEHRAIHHPPAPEALIVASYNIHKCVGVDKRFDPHRIATVIGELGADVVALQEADRRFGVRTGLLDMAAIERRTGLTLVPVSDTPGGHGWRGNALLVRHGSAVRIRCLTLPGAEPRGALVVDLQMRAGPLRVVATHLGLLRRHRALQAAAILAAITEAEPMPTLLLGDLNEWRPSIPSSLTALEPLFGPFAHPQPSFPSRLPFLALDRILGHPRGLVTAPTVHDTPLARLASDHLPLRTRIDLSAAQERVAAGWVVAA
ncbi:endonuclease/exonuclease/phosphatase family metal-dependent hydrolase [Humitalea rosea]|uniref:Endonuclease/exonuclease/phosphatase family metal-dependent hydrolase n=1 Tax=Humitalea rosea TaxID=990373 RepID=A0A2W7KB77_9PROT|nr:endonuclease/exonuclease/phosphatase family protein [Humitalea rosea]PZW44860.1 endonuclease/exonuclease/phosphatase family metal-dependent hydrolase [Humitalea rosea]